MEKENTNSGSVYVTVDGHLNPVHVSMKGTGEEVSGVYAGRCGEGAQGNGNAYHGHDVL